MKLKTEKNTEATISSEDKNENENENENTTKMYTINIETGNVLNLEYLNEVENNEEQYNQSSEEKNNTNSKKLEQPSTRLLYITKTEHSSYGFDLTRTKWDPYPWVSNVEKNSPAAISGLKVGDCLLEVNGKDVLGLRIADIAKLVKAKSEHVTLLLWNAGGYAKFDTETLCDAPMPHTLQRLSIIVQSILTIIECPICLDTIGPPAMQCQNGHLLCVNCRIRSDKCPICRYYYTPRQAIIAEQIYAAITSAFNLCRNEDKLRQKLFGTNVKHPQQQQQQQEEVITNNIVTMSQYKEIKSNATTTTATTKVCKHKAKSNGVSLPSTNKFFTKLLHSKTCSVDNLSNTTTTQTQIETTATTAIVRNNASWSLATSSSIYSLSNCNPALNVTSATNDSNISNELTKQTATNQLNMNPTTTQPNNCIHLDNDGLQNKKKILLENEMSKHFSLNTTEDLFKQQNATKVTK